MGLQQEGAGKADALLQEGEGAGSPGEVCGYPPTCRLARPTDWLPAATGLVRGAALRTFSLRTQFLGETGTHQPTSKICTEAGCPLQ